MTCFGMLRISRQAEVGGVSPGDTSEVFDSEDSDNLPGDEH